MLKVDFKDKTTCKFLDKLPAKQFKQIIAKVFALLRDPFPNDSSQLKGDDAYRADIGEYRIIYIIEKDTLIVLAIGKRNDGDVYKRYSRKK